MNLLHVSIFCESLIAIALTFCDLVLLQWETFLRNALNCLRSGCLSTSSFLRTRKNWRSIHIAAISLGTHRWRLFPRKARRLNVYLFCTCEQQIVRRRSWEICRFCGDNTCVHMGNWFSFAFLWIKNVMRSKSHLDWILRRIIVTTD